MAYSELTSQPLSLDAALAQVRSPRNGGYATFSGDVRDHDDGRSVAGIDYQTYEELARRELARIVDEAEARWPGTLCAVLHRFGKLDVGETSVVVAAGAPHRAEAFEACRWMIDTLKTAVPIWKREEYLPPTAQSENGDASASAESVWIEGERLIPAAAPS